ncbi:MAG TPA: MarR family transcriptional regulator [Bacillota bacterium]
MGPLENDSVYTLFGRVVRLHYCRMHMLLEKVGVYPGQPPLLLTLGKTDGQSQRELAEKLRIKAATITVMVKRMESAGLVERRNDPDDQRITRVYLTDLGRVVLGKVRETLKAMEGECFCNFTAEEQIILRRLFMQMRENLLKVCGKEADS